MDEKVISVKEILEKVSKLLELPKEDDDRTSIRYIQRKLKEQKINPVDKIGRTPVYLMEQIEKQFFTIENLQYFAIEEKQKNVLSKYRNKNFYIDKVEEMHNLNVVETDKLLEDVGIGLSEILTIQSENIKKPTYLTVEELKVTNRKGLTKYSDLTEEELLTINGYNYTESQGLDFQEKFVNRFNQYKLQIMLEALFKDRGFYLDEKKLENDVVNELMHQEVEQMDDDILRSLDDLKRSDNYYERKE